MQPAQPWEPEAGAGVRGKREEEEAAGSSCDPELRSLDRLEQRKQTQPPPIQGIPGGCTSPLPALSLSLSFPLASTLLPSYCHPPALLPMTHGVVWPFYYVNGFRVILNIDSRLRGFMWLWGSHGHLEPQGGAPRCRAGRSSPTVVTVSRILCFRVISIYTTGPKATP